MAEDVKILSLIPESLHETLIVEVQDLLKEREEKKSTNVSSDIKNFVTKNYQTTKQKK